MSFLSKIFLVAAFVAGGLFIGGFLKFSTAIIDLEQKQDIESGDAIAVLTGGSKRITQALELLQQGKGARLLISGVNPDTPIADLRRAYPQFETQFGCCVDTETLAVDTTGNARETAKWVGTKKYQSLIIVTSAYHMPRSLLEFRRALPQTELISYPVPHDALLDKNWWHEPKNVRLLLSEYVKYIGAKLRTSLPTFYTDE